MQIYKSIYTRLLIQIGCGLFVATTVKLAVRLFGLKALHVRHVSCCFIHKPQGVGWIETSGEGGEDAQYRFFVIQQDETGRVWWAGNKTPP